jgi:uncharacterized LabA/DUF88 family protein
MDRNIAFVDGQNLYLGTNFREKQTAEAWKIDMKKLRRYLKDKYAVLEAYYFIGCANEKHEDLYTELQKAGFIVLFRDHNPKMTGKKKGNVDSDIIFHMMKSFIEEPESKMLLISGDGDYKRTVDYLIKHNRFKKILFPNPQYASSLYKELGAEYFDYLDNFKTKIKQ